MPGSNHFNVILLPVPGSNYFKVILLPVPGSNHFSCPITCAWIKPF